MIEHFDLKSILLKLAYDIFNFAAKHVKALDSVTFQIQSLTLSAELTRLFLLVSSQLYTAFYKQENKLFL